MHFVYLVCFDCVPWNKHTVLYFRVLERKPDTNAFVRTTTAVTMFNAGVKVKLLIFKQFHRKLSCKQLRLPKKNTKFFTTLQVNVIPSLAEAYVNLRIHSAQSLQEVESENLFSSFENSQCHHDCFVLNEMCATSHRSWISFITQWVTSGWRSSLLMALTLYQLAHRINNPLASRSSRKPSSTCFLQLQ